MKNNSTDVAQVATIELGQGLSIEGLMLPDGSFGVSLQQLRELAFPSTYQTHAKRELETACGKGFQFKKHKTTLSNNPQIVIPLEKFAEVLFCLSQRGHKKAISLYAKLNNISMPKQPKKDKRPKNGYIYLLEGVNILKLGYSTNVEKRIISLSRWQGELELVAKVKGTINKEKSLHSMLHQTGDYFGDEWYPVFRKHEILSLMDSMGSKDSIKASSTYC